MPAITQPSAPRLVASHAEIKEEDLWQQLCEEHYDRLYRLACRFAVEPGEVEDVVQQALVIAFKRLPEVEDIRDPGAWLRGITVRVILRHLRWRRLRETKRWLLPHSPIAPAPIVTPEQNLAASEEIDSVRSVIKKLSPKLRNVLVLCDIEEMKPAEVSRQLGVSVETVRSRRRLAKKKFLEIWEQEQR